MASAIVKGDKKTRLRRAFARVVKAKDLLASASQIMDDVRGADHPDAQLCLRLFTESRALAKLLNEQTGLAKPGG
jgi:hypothetical protein